MSGQRDIAAEMRRVADSAAQVETEQVRQWSDEVVTLRQQLAAANKRVEELERERPIAMKIGTEDMRVMTQRAETAEAEIAKIRGIVFRGVPAKIAEPIDTATMIDERIKVEREEMSAIISEKETAEARVAAMTAEGDAAEQRAAVMAAAGKLRVDSWDSCTVPGAACEGCDDPRDVAAIRHALSATGAKVERGFAHQSHRNPGVWILSPERTTADGGQTWSRPAMLVTFEEAK